MRPRLILFSGLHDEEKRARRHFSHRDHVGHTDIEGRDWSKTGPDEVVSDKEVGWSSCERVVWAYGERARERREKVGAGVTDSTDRFRGNNVRCDGSGAFLLAGLDID